MTYLLILNCIGLLTVVKPCDEFLSEIYCYKITC